MIHDDIKEDNIGLLFRPDGRVTYKLIDPGRAQKLDQAEWEQAKAISAQVGLDRIPSAANEEPDTAAYFCWLRFGEYTEGCSSRFLPETLWLSYVVHAACNPVVDVMYEDRPWKAVDQTIAARRPIDRLLRALMPEHDASATTTLDIPLRLLREAYPEVARRLMASNQSV